MTFIIKVSTISPMSVIGIKTQKPSTLPIPNPSEEIAEISRVIVSFFFNSANTSPPKLQIK